MKIYLRDLSEKVVEAWKVQFGNCPDFEVSLGDIFEGPKADAIVSPANSFGFMDGGIDAAYSKKFGDELAAKLRGVITDWYDGELMVGQAVILPTGDEDFPYLISAPTMRVPSVVRNSVNAYLAFRATLKAVRDWNDAPKNAYKQINSILCPGLGTAIGQIHPFACARQMFEAYQVMVLGKRLKPRDCAEIWYNQQELLGWPPYELKVDGRDVINKEEKGDVDIWKGEDLQ